VKRGGGGVEVVGGGGKKKEHKLGKANGKKRRQKLEPTTRKKSEPWEEYCRPEGRGRKFEKKKGWKKKRKRRDSGTGIRIEPVAAL